MTFTNRLSLGVSVNKSNASRVHETGTVPYTGGSRLNPDVVFHTGEHQVKRERVQTVRKKK